VRVVVRHRLAEELPFSGFLFDATVTGDTRKVRKRRNGQNARTEAATIPASVAFVGLRWIGSRALAMVVLRP